MGKAGRPKGSGNKDPYKNLPDEFKENVDSMDEVEIRKTVSKVALDQAELMLLEKADQHLAEAKFAAKEAGATYKEGTKANKLKISYCRSILENKGKL